jgi:hydrogenase 3 maturation protease
VTEVRSFLKPWLRARILILGVGSSSRRDDGAGPELIKRLRGRTRAALLDGASAPENRVKDIVALKPELILLVDAAQLDAEPGAVRLLPEESIGGAGVGTHGLPLHMLLRYLRSEMKFQAALIGIQPRSLEFGEGLSPEVEAAVQGLERLLREELPIGS